MDSTAQIWEDIYKAGNFMEYPSEFFIRLLRRTESSLGIKGVTLDHGCGSGNNAECFYKAGYDIICSEVSRAALEITRDRLLKAGHSNPSCTLIDTTLPLSVQLPKYDNVICWLSLYYSEEKAMASSITQLISGMSSGGFFWLAMPTKKDLLFRLSKQRRGQTRVLGNNAGPQKGAVLTIFDEPSQIEKMFSGTKILDVGKYGMTFENCQHEYFVINARKI
jgi:hypothetical protein